MRRSPPQTGGAATPRHRHAVAQQAGVRLLRRIEHSTGLATLHDHSVAHDQGLLGELAHDGEVVADEDVCHTSPRADVGEQVEHLRLDRDVQRRHGLVEDDQPRIRGEGAGDGDSLALPRTTGGARPSLSSNDTASTATRSPNTLRRLTTALTSGRRDLFRGDGVQHVHPRLMCRPGCGQAAPATASSATITIDLTGSVKAPTPASRIVTLIAQPKKIPSSTPDPVPSSATSTDSQRTAERVWRRVMPTARSSPSSRVRS